MTKELTVSQRFTNEIQRQYQNNSGALELSAHQQRLAQHLYARIDETLKAADQKRLSSGKQSTPYTWANVNMGKLSIDAVHRIELGLDALTPNHIHPVPYFNGHEKKWDIQLQVGYIGKLYYRTELALEKPKNITFELVHESDEFQIMKKDNVNPVESYSFKVCNVFSRGKVIGGFGYIEYDDPTKNKLIIVTLDDFDAARGFSKSDFWQKHPKTMMYKTIVHRVCNHIQIDPKKITEAYIKTESASDPFVEADNFQNSQSIDIELEKVETVPEAKVAQDAPDF